MATYHLSYRPQQKNKYGHRVNFLSHFQYITRSGRYSDREDLVYSESGNVPDCKELSEDINRYWEAASEYGRKNGRAYRDVTIALQEEFTQEKPHGNFFGFPWGSSFFMFRSCEGMNPHFFIAFFYFSFLKCSFFVFRLSF